ncbi:MAG: four helix bundle protein [Balneolaceae bacterium]
MKDSDFKSFQSLKVWKLARKIRREIFELCKRLPKEEKYKLIDQMIRSSRSIGNNIAEGYGRYHFQENIQYCRQSRGSQYELIDHLITALDCNYIQVEDYSQLIEQLEECIKMTNGYIAYLNRKKSDYNIKEDPIDYNPTGLESEQT